MSNLLKSKTFKVGGLIVAMAIAVAMMLSVAVLTANAQTTVVLANEFTYSGVMKQGMSGPGISTLQAALNTVNTGVSTIIVDGKFGPATVGAVQRFQSTHGLVADGVVGPMTGESLRLATRSLIVIPTGSLPAGCTSTSGFSTVSGVSCAVMVTFPAGCSSSSGFSSTTGLRCDGGGSPGLPSGCSSTSGFSSTTGLRCDGGAPSLPSGCTSTSGFSSTTGNRCDGGSSSGNNNNLSGGETSIDDVNVNDADDDSLREGTNESPVAEIEFDVNDADATLVRADVVFQAADDAEESDPWSAFDNVYLMDGSDVIAEVSADDEDMWDDADDIISGTPANQASSIRFNNIDEDYQEGASASLWIAVDVASSVDGASDGDADWSVGIEEDGLRFTDGAGLDSVVDSTDVAQFSIEEAGAQSDLNVNKASDSPESSTLEVKENTSSEHEIAIFRVDTDEDGDDVKINDFPVTLTIAATGTGEDMADVVDDVFVVIDGTEYSADQAPHATDAAQTFTFEDIDDDDVIVAAGDDLEVSVRVKFQSQGSTTLAYNNGTTIVAAALLTSNDIEDAETGDDVDDIDGTATGEVMTLAGAGILVEVNSATTTITANDDAGFNDGATFAFNVDITAFGDNDVYINRNNPDILETGTVDADLNEFFTIEVSGGAALLLPTGTIADNSDADEAVGDTGAYGAAYSGELFYRLSDGETETFTITVTATNQTNAKQVRAFLSSIQFTTDNVEANDAAHDAMTASTSNYTANLAEDSQTPFRNIQ